MCNIAFDIMTVEQRAHRMLCEKFALAWMNYFEYYAIISLTTSQIRNRRPNCAHDELHISLACIAFFFVSCEICATRE